MQKSHTEFRVLVCGGRDYGYRYNEETNKKERYQPEVDKLFHTLDLVRQSTSRPLVVIEGEQRGADLFAREWAESRGVEVRGFPADWEKYKKAAGFIRNKQMIVEGQPHAVIAFPGGVGTKMMVSLAQKSQIPVKVIS